MVTFNTKKYSDRGNIKYPGHYILNKIIIKTPDGKSENLFAYYASISIHENIFSQSITGIIDISENLNLIKTLPINGEETLEITITDGIEIEEYIFKIYKISDISNPSFNTINYKLYFTTEEDYKDHHMTWSKAYNLTKFEDGVKDILNNCFGSKKELLFEETDKPRCFILPLKWSPFKSINWMASESYTKKCPGGTYLFFETSDRYNFLPLENLLDDTANIPYGTIKYKPYRKTENKQIEYDERNKDDCMTFEDFKIVKNFDVFENMRMGLYSNSAKVIDIMKRESYDVEYDYFKEFNTHKHLKGYKGRPAYPLNSSKFEEFSIPSPDKHKYVILKHSKMFSNEDEDGNQIEEWFPSRRSQLQQIENFKIVGALPGHLGLKAGMIVNFALHSPEKIAETGEVKRDEIHSGQYLITALKKQIKRDKFYVVIEMVKDSKGESNEKTFWRELLTKDGYLNTE